MPDPSLEAQIAEIGAHLWQRCDQLGRKAAEVAWSEIDFFSAASALSREDLARGCAQILRFLLGGLTTTAEDNVVAARADAIRPLVGSPWSAVTATSRISCRLLGEEIVTLASVRPLIGREALIRSTARIWMAQSVLTHPATGSSPGTDRRNRSDQASLWEIAAILGDSSLF